MPVSRPRHRNRILALICAVNSACMRVNTVAVQVADLLRDTAHILRHQHELKELLVLNLDELRNAVANLGTELSGAVDRVADDVRRLVEKVAELEVDATKQSEIDAIVADLNSSVDRVKAIDPVADVPVEPTPEQPQV